MQVFSFINDVFLKMTWLSDLMGGLVNLVGLDNQSQLGASQHFARCDVVKIFLLLPILIIGVPYIQSYFPPERTRKILGRYAWQITLCRSVYNSGTIDWRSGRL